MRHNIFIYFILSVILFFSSCNKDEDVAITTVNIMDVVIAPQYTTSTVQCAITSDGTIANVALQYSQDESFADYKSLVMTEDEGYYSASLDSLSQGSMYYIRYKVSNTFSSMMPNHIDTICTRAYTLPVIHTDSVVNITVNSAVCCCKLADWGCDTMPIVGICYTSHPKVSIKDMHHLYPLLASGSTFSCDISNLEENTTYYIRAYAQNVKGIAYGGEIEFTTISIVKPTITTNPVTNISYTSATCGGDIAFDGGADVTERGICYSTSSNPTILNNKVSCGKGDGSFTCNLTDLVEGTTYYVRAYASNNKGTAYGEQMEFTTKAYSVPAVATTQVLDIKYTSAICGGKILFDGGLEITKWGVCYSTSGYPTVYDNVVISDNYADSVFSCNLVDLAKGTTYYIRAYATNREGTAYGEQETFTTTIGLPTISTDSVLIASSNSVNVYNHILSLNGGVISEYGICWSISSNPTIAGTHTSNSGSVLYFTENISELNEGTTYYFRSYAQNSAGVGYGNEIVYTFPSKPNITFSAYRRNSSHYFWLRINDTGGSDITEIKIKYSYTTPIPYGSTGGSGSYKIMVVPGQTIYEESVSTDSNAETKYTYQAVVSNIVGSTTSQTVNL